MAPFSPKDTPADLPEPATLRVIPHRRNAGQPKADAPSAAPAPEEPVAAPDAPEPEQAPEPAAPPTLASIHAKLCKPFPLKLVEVLPAAANREKTRAMATAYVDPRCYQTRLDRLAGPDGWTVEYRQISDRAILCRLTVLGVVREDVGECNADDPNQATSAAMQAFKRACSAFGLGRYLYSLDKPWAEYDADRKAFRDAKGVAREIYRLAGLLDKAAEA